jgi:hypothetical protein
VGVQGAKPLALLCRCAGLVAKSGEFAHVGGVVCWRL